MTAPSFSSPEEDIRLACLRLAVQAHERTGADIFETARAYFGFVSGGPDAGSDGKLCASSDIPKVSVEYRSVRLRAGGLLTSLSATEARALAGRLMVEAEYLDRLLAVARAR